MKKTRQMNVTISATNIGIIAETTIDMSKTSIHEIDKIYKIYLEHNIIMNCNEIKHAAR